MERIEMSQEERDKLDWLKRGKDGVITQREAADKMGVSDRWVRHLLKRMKKRGDAVVVHGLRGRASNRKIAAQTQNRAIELLKHPDWHDFGPTFASEQLAKRHKIQVGKGRSGRGRLNSMRVISPIRASSDSARRSFRSRLRSSIPHASAIPTKTAPLCSAESDFEGIVAKQRPGVSEI